jgi:hypothetical protein
MNRGEIGGEKIAMIASEAPFVQSGNLARGSKRSIKRVQQRCQRLIGERSV